VITASFKSSAQLSSACPAHMILVIGICRSTIFSSDTSTLSFTLFAIFFPFSDRIVSTNNRYPCLVLFLMETDQCVLAAHSSVHLEGSCELNAGVCSTPLLLHLSPQIEESGSSSLLSFPASWMQCSTRCIITFIEDRMRMRRWKTLHPNHFR
jgi:hypothetical protein